MSHPLQPLVVQGLTIVAGRTLKEVCEEKPEGVKVWQTELSMFKGWGQKDKDKDTKG